MRCGFLIFPFLLLAACTDSPVDPETSSSTSTTGEPSDGTGSTSRDGSTSEGHEGSGSSTSTGDGSSSTSTATEPTTSGEDTSEAGTSTTGGTTDAADTSTGGTTEGVDEICWGSTCSADVPCPEGLQCEAHPDAVDLFVCSAPCLNCAAGLFFCEPGTPIPQTECWADLDEPRCFPVLCDSPDDCQGGEECVDGFCY
jgi:hypothetical protein